MSLSEFLAQLHELGIPLWCQNNRLHFEAPPEAMTPELRAELVRRKPALLEILGEDQRLHGPDPLGPASVEDRAQIPLSFAQQRLWFLDQLDPGGTHYNVVRVFVIKGALDVSALTRSLKEIVKRHEVLRTTFGLKGNTPVQKIAPSAEITVVQEDFRHLGEDEAMALVRKCGKDAYCHAFDLKSGPLLRVRLQRFGHQRWVLLMSTHHIVFDGWSIGVFYHELGVLYKAFSAGRPSPLDKLPIQYADFAAWQRRWLQGDELETRLHYWKRTLADLTTIQLPTDRTRPAVQTFEGAWERAQLPQSLSLKLKTLSQRHNATLFMTLFAAFVTLMHRYTGQDDIVVGTPIANRNHDEIEPLIGFFVNTLVLRTNLSAASDFLDLLGMVRKTALEAYQYQDISFERLVEALEPKRDLSRNPLFQIMFALQNAPGAPLTLEGLEIEPLEIEAVTTRVDMEVHIWEVPEGLDLWFIYNTGLFDAGTIRRMLNHFQCLLAGIAADSGHGLAHYPLMSEEERHRILFEWNRTAVDYPDKAALHQLFESQVTRTPGAVAVIQNGSAMTYAQLNARSNQLARHLKTLGVGPDRLAAICVDRTMNLVIGILAVLKAGGAYLPLDPFYPKERLGFMLKHASACVILTQAEYLGLFPEKADHTVCLDRDAHAWYRCAEHNLENDTLPENAAYLIYTSGSTGRPKGTLMPHGPLCNLVAWQLDNTTVGQGGRTLQFTSIGFDVSNQEMFSTWCGGGTLILISDRQRRDPQRMLTFLDDYRIERIFLPFVALQQLAETAMLLNKAPRHLREVITAGEQLQITEAMVRFFTRLEGCTLQNQYGPTETHVTTSLTLSGDPQNWPTLPSIGRPIANTRIYMLDRYDRPTPVGVPGELCIGGVSPARGYLNRPGSSAARFIADPFNQAPGARMYKSGDMARFLPDGNIQFLGRMDHQVKIRGFRVEPGEVEAAIARHPAIRQVTVTARGKSAGGNHLVAYVVPHKGRTISARKIRSFLKPKLPDFMIPGFFVPIGTMPLTPSGKVNRRALPPPETLSLASQKDHVPPRTKTEKKIAAVWQEILGIDTVGLHDNFFELGGHSLMATQVIARLHDVFDLMLPLRSLFEFPTVAGLNQFIEAAVMPDSNQAATGDREKETL